MLYLTAVLLVGLVTARVLASHDRSAEGKRHQRLQDVAEEHLAPFTADVTATIPQQITLIGLPVTFFISGSVSLDLIGRYLAGDPLGPFDTEVATPGGFIAFTVIAAGLSTFRGYQGIWKFALVAFGCVVAYRLLTLATDVIQIWQFGVGGAVCPAPSPDWRVRFSELCVALGTVVQCLNITGVLTEVQATMREPPPARESIGRAVALGYGVAGTYALSAGLLGYLAFGHCVRQNLLVETLPPPLGWIPALTNALAIPDVLASTLVFSQPVIDDLERQLQRALASCGRGFSPGVLRAFVGPLLMASYGVIAYAFPQIATMSALIGGLSSIPLTFILPSLIQASLSQRAGQRAVFFGIAGLGVVLAIASTSGSLYGLIQELLGRY